MTLFSNALADNSLSENRKALDWAQAPLWGESGRENGTFEVICQQVIDETSDIKTFVFQMKEKMHFTFKPGQFMTLMQELDGEMVYRSYTISSSPSRPYNLSLTIQKVEGGRLSGWLFDNLKPGTVIKATGPDGVFNLIDKPASKVLFLSASCGITPVMSMTRWMLDTCMESDIRFIHCAASEADIVYRRELEMLDEQHAHFNHSVVLDDRDGLLNQEMLQQLAPDLHSRTLYICGSPAYIEAVRQMVEAAGFDMSKFHHEVFNDAMIEEIASRNPVEAGAGAMMTLEKSGVAVEVNPGDLLVDKLLANKAPVIAACRAGVCGACKVQVLDGEVESSSQMTLTPAEIEQGYVLSCCSRVTGDVTVNI
ncbi:hybrid-cluster NAD(P)-dependent oxidoreductase [Parendozoicomonas haliclonae]|uniref:NADH oxidoreductase hcr n=1 Tax=Parendozoicomonas haliclonae TaxID=1960125 RepID=A0A1X7APM6_9GAMM|nr:hybrid-cluster NAD(P)-dependent oxidoreductase [Parendozoicomonas haliclonae]SMA50205.1 NADH oxidoreductase hcr [Parendozoicomonas haliclonae]